MAKEGRNILAMVFKNFIDSLKPRQFRGNLMGKDYLGNQYYEIPRQEAKRRPSRWYVPPGGDDNKFDEPLPAEWEAWLRFRRKEPPTEQEIEENLQLMRNTLLKAAQIDKKFGTGQNRVENPTSFPKYKDFEGYPGKKPGGTE